MGGAVSSGRDNNELIDNLMGGNYIRTRDVERVFRALDRADYMTPEARDQAYKDLAWRHGPLHMSAPCIYSEVMEGLELKPGLSFLNIGSGTGYLSTLVGLIIGSSGISHGVEAHPVVVEYATKKLSQFMENSPTLDEFDFCEPKFYHGNGLCLAPLQAPYDRVYCGAGCPEEYQSYFQQLMKIGGILVMPLNDNLLQVKRTGVEEWSTRSLLNVSFATLRVPTKDEAQELLRLDEQSPNKLQALARAVIRGSMRAGLRRRHPQLREPPPRAPPAKKACPRRICIPVDDDSDVEGLNALHDLDRASGANEMNALLSLVLSMGHNRVAGALRVDQFDSPTDSDSSDDDIDDADDGDDDGGGDGPDNDGGRVARNMESQSSSELDRTDSDNTDRPAPERGAGVGARAAPRSVIMFEFRDTPLGDLTPPRDAGGATPTRDATPPCDATPPRDATPPQDTADDKDPQSSSPGQSTSKEPSTSSSNDSASKPSEPRRRVSKGRRGSRKGRDQGEEAPDVPAEVEIYLGKSGGDPGTTMEWQEDGPWSDDDTIETSTSKVKEEKRMKLDSGIGEENTPSAGTSSTKSDDSDCRSTDEGCDGVKGRRRRQKRSHLSTRSSSSTDGEGSPSPSPRAAPRPPRGRARDSADARRVKLSLLMKRAVKELPLPHALQKYVNLGRCFEF